MTTDVSLLLQVIGEQQVEIRLLRQRIAELEQTTVTTLPLPPKPAESESA